MKEKTSQSYSLRWYTFQIFWWGTFRLLFTIADMGAETTVEVVKPYDETASNGIHTDTYAYENQGLFRNSRVTDIKIKAQKAGILTVAISSSASGIPARESKDIPLSIGQNSIPLDMRVGANDFLTFKASVSGLWFFDPKGKNPDGGSMIGTPPYNLCIGVTVARREAKKGIPYIALGDSITFGFGVDKSYAAMLAEKKNSTFTNLAVSGMTIVGENQLITRVNLVPEGFLGLSTLMIGINDLSMSHPLGDVDAVLAKKFEDLNVNASISEAFRLCVETYIRRAPDAILLGILPLKSGTIDPQIEKVREVQRKIYSHFSIPYSELHRECRITPITYSKLMLDAVHPSTQGHIEILRVLWGDINNITSFLTV